MKRFTHARANGSKILLEGLADGRPIKENGYLKKQAVYLPPTKEFTRYACTEFLETWTGVAGLTFADLGLPEFEETVEVSGYVDVVWDDGAPLPAKLSELVTDGYMAEQDFDSILTESPTSGLLTGGPTLTGIVYAYPGDLVITGTNLTAVSPLTTEITLIHPALIEGTEASATKSFGATARYIFLRNNIDQNWVKVPFVGDMTAAQCVAKINSVVASYISNGKGLGGSWKKYSPNIVARTPSDEVMLFSFGGVVRLELASEAVVVADGKLAANTLLLGAAFSTGSIDTGVVRGTVAQADITAGGGGTTLTIAAADLPSGVAVPDFAYININGFDLVTYVDGP